MATAETNERYLEEIYFLQMLGPVRSIDICKAMNYSKPTISVKMKKLKALGYINIDDNEGITLTKNGLIIAKKISERHLTLTNFLVNIGVNKQTAEEDACKIEHDLSDESFDKIKEYCRINKLV